MDNEVVDKNRIILDYILHSVGRDKRPYLKVAILDHEVLALLDSGASLTFIGKPGFNLVSRLGFRLDESNVSNCIVANGSTCKCIGTVTFPVSVENRVCLVKASVVPELPHELILGIDFWSKMGIIPDIRNNSWYFANEELAVVSNEVSSDLLITHSQRTILQSTNISNE